MYQKCIKDCAVSRHACNGNCVGTAGRKSNLNINPTRQPINLAYVLSFPPQSGKSPGIGLTKYSSLYGDKKKTGKGLG